MEYGIFRTERKFGCLQRAVIHSKYREVLLQHEYGKLYWFDYPCANDPELLVFWRVGDNLPCKCCYGRHCCCC